MIPKSVFLGKLRYFIPVLLLICGALFLLGADLALAGFGITPPYIRNNRLTRGSSFEQKITFVRSDPQDDLKVEITINAPEVADWITVDKGLEFIMASGEQKVPIFFRINVPKDAEYKKYSGKIRIRTSPVGIPKGGGVSIALGAQVDMDIEVVDKVLDFEVKRVRMADLEEGYTKWGLYFPGKASFIMTIQNTGNGDFGPTKTCFKIYDYRLENLLEDVCNKNEMETIPPFATDDITAEFPTWLKSGRYAAKFAIYKKDEIAQEGEVTLGISALGSIPGYRGYGFAGLSFQDKAKVVSVFGGAVLIFSILVFIAVLRRRKYRRRRASIEARRLEREGD